MRALLIVTRLFQMGLLCGSGRKFGGFVDLDLGKPAILVGAGHWLHDTPPIFSNRIMRFLKHRSWVRDRTTAPTFFGRGACASSPSRRLPSSRPASLARLREHEMDFCVIALTRAPASSQLFRPPCGSSMNTTGVPFLVLWPTKPTSQLVTRMHPGIRVLLPRKAP